MQWAKRFFRTFRLAALSIIFCAGPLAIAESGEVGIPDDLAPEIDYLLDLADPSNGSTFDPGRVKRVLDFVLSPKENSHHYHAGERKEAVSAYHQFDVQSDLERILGYAFNPDIPGEALLPASVRISYWSEGKNRVARLRERLPSLEAPLLVRGAEYSENTPDLTTGAYHAYEMDRALILFRHEGRPALISLSMQRGPSTVGKKGAILGTDDSWDYLYSGEKGLSRRGMGWVRSYMYDSFSVAILLPLGEGRNPVRCAFFKWLSAGWLGINMVNSGHIHEGLTRYAENFREMLENPRLPPPHELAGSLGAIGSLSPGELKEKVRRILEGLEKEYRGERILSRKPFSRLLGEGELADLMNRRQMEGLVGLEFMKCTLGKRCLDESLFPERP